MRRLLACLAGAVALTAACQPILLTAEKPAQTPVIADGLAQCPGGAS